MVYTATLHFEGELLFVPPNSTPSSHRMCCVCLHVDLEGHPQPLRGDARAAGALHAWLGLPRPAHRAEGPGGAGHQWTQPCADTQERSDAYISRTLNFQFNLHSLIVQYHHKDLVKTWGMCIMQAT